MVATRQKPDNNTAEIMDAEDPLFILYTSVLLENQEWCILQRDMVYTPILLKMYLIMKTTIFSGVLRILVG
jgi:hypothetical protein